MRFFNLSSVRIKEIAPRIGDGCVVRYNAVVDGCHLPPGFYVPSTLRIGPQTDLDALPDVARTNNELVQGYKKLQNEF